MWVRSSICNNKKVLYFFRTNDYLARYLLHPRERGYFNLTTKQPGCIVGYAEIESKQVRDLSYAKM